MDLEEKITSQKYEKYLLYFDRSVLANYRVSTHLYSLKEDDMGGELESIEGNNIDAETSDLEKSWIRVRFGFRRQLNGTICIAALAPDLNDLNDKDLLIWHGFIIKNPRFAKDDNDFGRWVSRYLEGSWEIDDGPKIQIARLVKLIRSLTQQTLGKPFFRFEENPLINYPIAENFDAYAKAHLELYRLIIDGLDKDCIGILANRLKITLTDESKTMNSLKEVLPNEGLRSAVLKPLKKCSEIRHKNHGLSPGSMKSFPAFDSFGKDLVDIESALEELKKWLETELSADSNACMRREEMLTKLFPKIIGPPRPEFKLGEIKKAEGKTIQLVEFGEVETHGIHRREEIIFHFTDGSSMAVMVGSNAINLSHKFKGMRPEDMSTDLMIFIAPSIQRI